MYKWHVHSALGRGRPLQSDLSRVADGIAVSLRQFHVSSTRAEDPAPQIPSSTRSKRLAKTSQEIQGLVSRLNSSSATLPPSKPGARGAVDARSLAVKPDGAPRIIYATNARSNFRGGSDRARGGFGRGGIIRGGLRGGLGLGLRGRGGFRGRGRGGPGAARAGRGGRGGKTRRGRGGGKANPFGKEEKFEYTDLEKRYMEEKRVKEAGERVPFQPPELSAEALYSDGPGPAVLVGKRGMTEIVERQMRVLAERPTGTFERNAELARRLLKGAFVKFVSDAEKDAVLEEAERLSAADAARISERKGQVVESKFEGFEPEDPKPLMGVFYLDKGPGPTAEAKRDESVQARVTRSMMRNESYGFESADAFRGEVTKRLPQLRKSRGVGPAKEVAA